MGILDFISTLLFLGILFVFLYFVVKYNIKEVNKRTDLMNELYIYLKNKNNKENF